MYQGDLVTCDDPLVQIRWLTTNSPGFLYAWERFHSQGGCRCDAPVLLMSWFPVPDGLYKQSPVPHSQPGIFTSAFLFLSMHLNVGG